MNSSVLPSASGLVRAADTLGATASFLCAIHCALLPLVLVMLPSVGLSVLADHDVERVFIACASALSVLTLWLGFRRHHRRNAFVFLFPGLGLLLLGVVFETNGWLLWHTVLVTLGGSLLATAHITNLRLAQPHVHTEHCRH